MPLTTRRAWLALASGLLVAGVGLAAAGPAAALSSPDEPGPHTRLAQGAVLTPGSGPVSVSVVIPITVPPSVTGLVPADELERYTGPFGVLTRKLDTVIGTPVAIGVDPMIIASIRVLGSSAPVSAAQWLARLEAASNEVFTLGYGDADLLAAARTDTLAALTPTGFAFAMDPTHFTPAPTAPPSPGPDETAQPDPDGPPPFPSTDEVLAWASTLPRIAWPIGEVAAANLAPLAAAGFTHVIVPSDEVKTGSVPLVTLDGIRGIVSDTVLSALLQNATEAISDTDRTSATAALVAALDAQASSSPGRGIVLTIGRETGYSQLGLSDALAGIAASEHAQLVSLGEILASAPTTSSLGDAAPDATRDAVFTSAASDAAAEAAFSSVLSDAAPLLDPRSLERIALYGNGWSTQPSDWSAAVTAFHDRSAEILDSVRIEHGNDVVLLARSTDFRVAVSNALPYPITVRVTIRPLSPILQAQGATELVVEPESTATASLKVEAVANGDVRVLSTLTSPTGVPIDSGSARVTVQAEWEGIGTLLVVVVLVLILGGGILRLVITRRRRGAATAAPAAGAAEETGAADD